MTEHDLCEFIREIFHPKLRI